MLANAIGKFQREISVHFIRLRLYQPTLMLTTENGSLRKRVACTGYVMSDLTVEVGGTNEFPRKVVVEFVEAVGDENSKLAYRRPFTEASSGQFWPCDLELRLPLNEMIENFLLKNDYQKQYLILAVEVGNFSNDGKPLKGPANSDSVTWAANVTDNLPAKIASILEDNESRPESVVPVVAPEPLKWQADALTNLTDIVKKQFIAAELIRNELKYIRSLLFFVVVGLVVAFTMRAL